MFVPKCRGRRNRKLFHSVLIHLIGNSLWSAVIAERFCENNFLLRLLQFSQTTLELWNFATKTFEVTIFPLSKRSLQRALGKFLWRHCQTAPYKLEKPNFRRKFFLIMIRRWAEILSSRNYLQLDNSFRDYRKIEANINPLIDFISQAILIRPLMEFFICITFWMENLLDLLISEVQNKKELFASSRQKFLL